MQGELTTGIPVIGAECWWVPVMSLASDEVLDSGHSLSLIGPFTLTVPNSSLDMTFGIHMTTKVYFAWKIHVRKKT